MRRAVQRLLHLVVVERRSRAPTDRTSRCRFSIWPRRFEHRDRPQPERPPPRAAGRTRSRSRRPRRADRAPPRRGPRRARSPGPAPTTGSGSPRSPACVTQVPSGRCVMNCPSRRPRMISKTKNGLPSDLSAIWTPSSSASCSERKASSSSSWTRSFGPEARRDAAARLRPDASRFAIHSSGSAGPRRPDQEDAVARHRQRERGEQRAPLLRREVQVVDQDDGRPLRGERSRRVHEHRLERVLRERLRARRRRLAAEQRVEGRDEERRLG